MWFVAIIFLDINNIINNHMSKLQYKYDSRKKIIYFQNNTTQKLQKDCYTVKLKTS